MILYKVSKKKHTFKIPTSTPGRSFFKWKGPLKMFTGIEGRKRDVYGKERDCQIFRKAKNISPGVEVVKLILTFSSHQPK